MVVIGVPVANQVVNDVHALSQAYHFQQLAKGFAKAFLSRVNSEEATRHPQHLINLIRDGISSEMVFLEPTLHPDLSYIFEEETHTILLSDTDSVARYLRRKPSAFRDFLHLMNLHLFEDTPPDKELDTPEQGTVAVW